MNMVLVCFQWFQSTPPRGGRRFPGPFCALPAQFQSTPPARGATRRKSRHPRRLAVSIHAPREGSDRGTTSPLLEANLFQSTPPARGATHSHSRIFSASAVSIHAPREGSDAYLYGDNGGDSYGFNPRPPRGERLMAHFTTTPQRLFQSTPPARGATTPAGDNSASRMFQSTPPARGATCARRSRRGFFRGFNPRPPRGERHSAGPCGQASTQVSIHAPARGATVVAAGVDEFWRVSIHAPARGATDWRLAVG